MLNFSGFYGDYDIVIGEEHYQLTLEKGVSDYVLNYVDPNVPIFDPALIDMATGPLPEGPTDDPPSTASGGFVTSPSVNVPEPSSLALGLAAAAGLLVWRRMRQSAPRQNP